MQILSTIPEMIWEGAILSIYVIVVGFNAKRATDLDRRGSGERSGLRGRRLTNQGPRGDPPGPVPTPQVL